MALWLLVDSDMYYQNVVKGETMEDVELKNDLKWVTLIVRLDNETVETIKKMADEQT